jgi:hypothetical protein
MPVIDATRESIPGHIPESRLKPTERGDILEGQAAVPTLVAGISRRGEQANAGLCASVNDHSNKRSLIADR